VKALERLIPRNEIDALTTEWIGNYTAFSTSIICYLQYSIFFECILVAAKEVQVITIIYAMKGSYLIMIDRRAQLDRIDVVTNDLLQNRSVHVRATIKYLRNAPFVSYRGKIIHRAGMYPRRSRRDNRDRDDGH